MHLNKKTHLFYFFFLHQKKSFWESSKEESQSKSDVQCTDGKNNINTGTLPGCKVSHDSEPETE